MTEGFRSATPNFDGYKPHHRIRAAKKRNILRLFPPNRINRKSTEKLLRFCAHNFYYKFMCSGKGLFCRFIGILPFVSGQNSEAIASVKKPVNEHTAYINAIIITFSENGLFSLKSTA